jgi:hypothetical protein
MAGAALILGIVLLIAILNSTPGRPLFSKTLKVIVGVLFLIFGAYVVFIAMHVPMAASYLLGQTIGCILIVGFFVAVGMSIRKRRQKK